MRLALTALLACLLLAACDTPEQREAKNAVIRELNATGAKEHVVPFIDACLATFESGTLAQARYAAAGFSFTPVLGRGGSYSATKRIAPITTGSLAIDLLGNASSENCGMFVTFATDVETLANTVKSDLVSRGFNQGRLPDQYRNSSMTVKLAFWRATNGYRFELSKL